MATKYDHIDFKPPVAVADAAAKGLEYRRKASPSNRGGLTPGQAAEQGIGSGVQRAVNLKNRDAISPEVIRQMVAFFARHEKNKGVPAEKKDEPWNAKGHVAWLLWGGDPGKRWAEKIRDQMDAADKGNAKKATRTYSRIAMYDFDGTLFRSWEQTPEWWTDKRPYSFFVRPESLNEPCIPARPGGEYWINKSVEAAQDDTRDPNTYSVLITGRIDVHRDRIRELLGQKGIRFDKMIFNPGMSAARFKTLALGQLLALHNNVREIVIWENENQTHYARYLAIAKNALGRDDVAITVHNIHEAPIPLLCNPTDFGMAARVAARALLAGLSREQLDGAFSVALTRFQQQFDRAIEGMEQHGQTPEDWANGGAYNTYAGLAYTFGKDLVLYATQLKQVPPQHRRMFELARREFGRVNRFDRTVWFGKHIDMLRMLYTIDTWPNIIEPGTETGDGAVTKIGAVRIVNQSDVDPAASIKMVQQAIQHIQRSPVPNIKKILYGDVFIVGAVHRKKTVAAQYFVERDIIEVLSLKRFADLELRATIHEFGHRYWRKFLDPDTKRAWIRHHTEMTIMRPDNIELPKVGDVLPYVVGTPKIVSIDEASGAYNVETKNGGTGYILRYNLIKMLQQRAVVSAFPTAYAATDPEEHFCESFSLDCVGMLHGENKAKFDSIVVGHSANPTLTLDDELDLVFAGL